jgi:hypothetical protein
MAQRHGLISLFLFYAQAQVQRLLTLPSLAKAQAALWIQVQSYTCLNEKSLHF